MDSQLIKARCIPLDFRELVPPTSAGAGLFVQTIVKTAGTPTVKLVAGGAMQLALDATSEVQGAYLSNGDVLLFDIDDIVTLTGKLKLSATLPASVTAVVGLAAAHNATLDSNAAHAWFRFQGSNSALLETDDAVHDVDDVATGLTSAGETRKFAIDFSSGVQSVGAPGNSVGGKGSVQFFLENASGQLVPVGRLQLFDMSSYAGGLQFYAAIQKTTGTAVGSLEISDLAITVRK